MYDYLYERDIAIAETIRSGEYESLLEEVKPLIETDHEAAGVAMFCAWATGDRFLIETLVARALEDSLGALLLQSLVTGVQFEEVCDIFLSTEEASIALLEKARGESDE